jgi:hypothetical protein
MVPLRALAPALVSVSVSVSVSVLLSVLLLLLVLVLAHGPVVPVDGAPSHRLLLPWLPRRRRTAVVPAATATQLDSMRVVLHRHLPRTEAMHTRRCRHRLLQPSMTATATEIVVAIASERGSESESGRVTGRVTMVRG